MKTNQRNDCIATIESVIESIRKSIKSNLEAGFSVERKNPAKGTSHRGLLRINETGDSENNDDRYTFVTFVFYASVYFPSRLGLVAIYSDKVTSIRPFVDVQFPQNPLTDPYSMELELLSGLVADYSDEHFAIGEPSLIDMIKLRMYEMGLTQAALAKLIGVNPSRVCEYLSGKKQPTF